MRPFGPFTSDCDEIDLGFHQAGQERAVAGSCDAVSRFSFTNLKRFKGVIPRQTHGEHKFRVSRELDNEMCGLELVLSRRVTPFPRSRIRSVTLRPGHLKVRPNRNG